MPKKTRQEKIIAKLRRLESSQNIPDEAAQQNQENKTPTISLDLKSENTQDIQTNSTSIWDYSYVYKELTKSLIFAALAIGFQIILAIFVLK